MKLNDLRLERAPDLATVLRAIREESTVGDHWPVWTTGVEQAAGAAELAPGWRGRGLARLREETVGGHAPDLAASLAAPDGWSFNIISDRLKRWNAAAAELAALGERTRIEVPPLRCRHGYPDRGADCSDCSSRRTVHDVLGDLDEHRRSHRCRHDGHLDVAQRATLSGAKNRIEVSCCRCGEILAYQCEGELAAASGVGAWTPLDAWRPTDPVPARIAAAVAATRDLLPAIRKHQGSEP